MKQHNEKDFPGAHDNYKVGTEVVLSTANLMTYCPHILRNIKTWWRGPFRTTKDVSPVVFGLNLPPGWHIHRIFHLSKLKRYIRSEDFFWEIEPPPLVLVGDIPEYEVERIL